MKKQEAYGFIHCHSDHSLNDSALKLDELVKGACKMGAKAITLTDHGTCTGIFEFMKLCHKYGIKPIPGVEAYIDTEYSRLSHLVLLAKNYEGYKEICTAVTRSNEHIETILKVDYPKMNKEILSECFGSGNVVATSACVSGVLASVLLYNGKLEKQQKKLQKKLLKYNNPNDAGYLDNRMRVNQLDEKIKELIKKRTITEVIAKKNFSKRLKGLESIKTDEELYKKTKHTLDKEIAETQNAKIKLADIKEELKNTRRNRTLINNRCRDAEKSHKKYIAIADEIAQLENKKLSENAAIEIVRNEIKWYQNLFGPDNFFIEIQNHGLKDEAYVMKILSNLAMELNVPVVAANDIHILKREDAPARQMMRSLRFKKLEEISESDKELYMKSDQELYNAICQVVPEKCAKKAMENIRIICDLCNVEIPKESHYPKYRDRNGNEVEDSAQLLRCEAEKGIDRLFGKDKFSDVYQNRLNYELDVIISLGYADYLLIVADYINFARELSREKGNGTGYGVGPGRGSGAGCLTNYLLGITNIDPIKYNLKFERFLNKDRVSMPDIDTDFSEEVREETIDYVRQIYRTDSVSGIRTKITQAGKLAVNNVVRFLIWKNPEEEENYTNALNRIGNDITPKLDKCIDEIKMKYPDQYTSEILNKAKLIEGTARSVGVHAAGIIIGDGIPLNKYVPLLYNTKKKQWVAQCDMAEAEELGLLKMDFLGLINLDVITECIRRIKNNTGQLIDPDKIPFKKEVFQEIFSKGKTGCVFQFESGGMKRMLKQFQPETFEDIMLLVAAYRPGPMDSIPHIIDIKHGRMTPQYAVDSMKDILAPTYGQVIYQEQLMDIFHICAGFTPGESDIIRKYMSKKKEELFLAYKPQFITGIMKNGCSQEAAAELWNSLVNFAKYAFNKSHAAAYAYISYVTAYLKYYYPTEYMTAVLNYSSREKIPAYLHECKIMKIDVIPPDINRSQIRFEDSGKSIIYGLQPIKKVSSSAQVIIDCRNRDGYFTSFHDFMLRTTCIDKESVAALIKSGCFDELKGKRRTATVSRLDDFSDSIRKLQKKKVSIAELEQLLNEETETKEKRSLKRRIENAYISYDKMSLHLKQLDTQINSLPPDNSTEVLKDERDLLGAYVSGHPLQSFSAMYSDKEITLIDEFEPGNICCAGIVSDVRIVHRKKDGADMAFFNLEDPTGVIGINCFVESYKKYRHLIADGSIIKIIGKGTEEENFNGDGTSVPKITVKNIFRCRPQKPPVLISYADSNIGRKHVLPEIMKNKDLDGHRVWLHNSMTGEIKETDEFVNERIINTDIPYAFVQILDL